jgi:hyperosmotically inducible periplasmic protein
MKTFENRSTLFRNTLIAAALAAALGAAEVARADAGDAAVPRPQSDSGRAATTDAVISAQVRAKYMGEGSLKDSSISITTTNGVVTLAGTLANEESKRIAIELAKGIAGVKDVVTSALSSSSG